MTSITKFRGMTSKTKYIGMMSTAKYMYKNKKQNKVLQKTSKTKFNNSSTFLK